MSKVVTTAIKSIGWKMPHEMRNNARFEAIVAASQNVKNKNGKWPLSVLLDWMSGKEKQRLAVLLDWMWDTVLPQLQPLTDKQKFGDEWRIMCEQRTWEAAHAAADAAMINSEADAAVHNAFESASNAVFASNVSAPYGAPAPDYAAYFASKAVCLCGAASNADHFWQTVDPIEVFERMVEV